MDHEIELTVLTLNKAMIIACMSFALPLQIIMTYIYTKYTDRNLTLRTSYIIDIGIFICVAIWFEKYQEYNAADGDGFGLSDPPKQDHIWI